MSRPALPTFSALAVLALLSPASTLWAAEWTGWITDESCGAKGANRAHKECAEKCHRGGARLVFFDNAEGKVYRLDDQGAAEANLGHEVRVHGEAAGNAIQVESIQPAV